LADRAVPGAGHPLCPIHRSSGTSTRRSLGFSTLSVYYQIFTALQQVYCATHSQ
jgi:hypothetical protein